MKVTELFKLITIPIILLSLVISLGTFLAYYADFSQENNSFWSLIIWMLDLRSKQNPATWFKGVLYLLCGLSFLFIGLNKSKTTELSTFSKVYLLVVSCVLFLFSAEVMFSLHNKLNVRVVSILGLFSSKYLESGGYHLLLFLFVPAGISIFILLPVILNKLIIKLPDNNKTKRIAKLLLYTAICAIPVMIFCEGMQGYLWYNGIKSTVFSCFEEVFELVALLSFIGFNRVVAEQLNL